MTAFPTVRVAAVQATPVILDAEASVAKAVGLLGEAAEAGAQLAVLPETFVSLYPSNAWAAAASGMDGASGLDELWERMWASSVDVPGPLVDELIEACRRHDHRLRDRRQRARVGSPRDALQHAARARAGRPALAAPQADADPPRAALPRDRRRRRPRRRRHARRPGRRPHLLGEPDAARAGRGLPRRASDLGRPDRRHLGRLAGDDAAHRDRVRRVRRRRAAVHPGLRLPGRLPAAAARGPRRLRPRWGGDRRALGGRR